MDPKATHPKTADFNANNPKATDPKASVPWKAKPKFGLQGKDYRKTGDRFTFAEALSIFSNNVQGKAFHYEDFMKAMQAEIARGTLKTQMGENKEMIFWFEPLHPINKYPELETLPTFCDEVKTEKMKYRKG